MLDIVVSKLVKDHSGTTLRKLVDPAALLPARDLDRRRALDRVEHGPLRVEDMVSLYRAIKLALPDRPHIIVEIIAANRGEGVSSVVRGLAQAAALIGSARVLICDATPERSNFSHFRVDAPAATLDDFAAKRAGLDDAIVDAPGAGLSLCALSDPESGSRVAVNIGAVDAVLAMLRERYDLIVIDAPPTNRNVLGPALAKKADGVVLVVEAERTRTPIAAAALHAIEINAGRVLGVVLNKRRFHIPGFVYRWL